MYTEQMSQGLSIAGAPIHSQSLAAATPTGTGGIDMQKFRRALFILDVGTFGASATVDMKLQESPDNCAKILATGLVWRSPLPLRDNPGWQ